MAVLLDRYSKNTFGQLTYELKKKGVPTDLLDEIEAAVKDRNWLAHDYFCEVGTSIFTTIQERK